jgi:glycosyltransferase involved in cell wall biosynthesis
MKQRKKIVLCSPFRIHPALGGGQLRTLHLAKSLSRETDVVIVSLGRRDELASHDRIGPGLTEICVTRSQPHLDAEYDIARQVESCPVSDVTLPELVHLSPEFGETFRQAATGADAVIASHPYLFRAIRRVWGGPVWYDAHNVESLLKESIIAKTDCGRRLLQSTWTVENECCHNSSVILACSSIDREWMNDLYAVQPGKILVVPNGVDLAISSPPTGAERQAAKSRLRCEDQLTAVFVGSWHGPNLEAIRHIINFAQELPGAIFLIAGSACLHFKDQPVPENVRMLGVLSDAQKQEVFAAADVALNPMVSGSGTNLKVLDYCASQVPLISTPHGVRGLGLRDGVHFRQAEIPQFPRAIKEAMLSRFDLAKKGYEERQVWAAAARHHVVTKFSWEVIGNNLAREIERSPGRFWGAGGGPGQEQAQDHQIDIAPPAAEASARISSDRQDPVTFLEGAYDEEMTDDRKRFHWCQPTCHIRLRPDSAAALVVGNWGLPEGTHQTIYLEHLGKIIATAELHSAHQRRAMLIDKRYAGEVLRLTSDFVLSPVWQGTGDTRMLSFYVMRYDIER